MSKETALQIAMRITKRYANSLFDEHTQRGRQFIQEMSECLEQEREQILQAYREGRTDDQSVIEKYQSRTAAKYYNETFGGDK
jgi:hypothetical protein